MLGGLDCVFSVAALQDDLELGLTLGWRGHEKVPSQFLLDPCLHYRLGWKLSDSSLNPSLKEPGSLSQTEDMQVT
jgi:hypothetical protein